MARTADDVYTEFLVMGAQDGDPRAMSALVEHWHPRIARQAVRLTGDGDAAAEVMQECWLAVVRGLRRLDDPARFRPWAYRIVTNKCADWVRRRTRSRDNSRPLDHEPTMEDQSPTELDDELAAK